MVATRRSSTQHVDVELSLNGKEAKKVIPIAEQRKSSLREYSSENDDNEEPPKPVKKETRGRKRKTITTDSAVTGESNAPKKKTTTTKNGAALGGHSIENVVDSSKFSQPPVDTIKKVETRGRKRKNPDSSPNTTTTTTTTPRTTTTTTTTTTPRAASTSKTTASKTTSTPARGVNTRRKSAIASALNDNNASAGVGRSSRKTAISTDKGDTSLGVAASATQDTLGPISTPAITGSNVIAGINVNKHNINHLLTKDSPPPLGGLYGRHPGGVGGIGGPTVAVTSGAHNSYERSTSPAMASYQQQQQQQHLYQQQQHLQHTQPNFFHQQQQQQQQQSQIHYQHHLQQPQQFHPAGTQLPPPPITTTRSQTNVASQQAGGRIPITSIISQKIDALDIPLMMMEEDDTGPEDKKTKRRYRVDKDNIKINKRIMSQDTEDVIKMFKKFDDEILTNPEARQRLLSLGFETRKRYITTFKHFIRFCCRKKLDNFFVTGELMKEFYQEQFANSTSSKPVIRLRKMDPAFSKLQEINFLVYHLENKEIPNRHIALEYLVYKEIGKDSPPSSHSSVEETSSSETNSKKKRRMVKKIYKAQQLSGVAQNGGDEKQPTEASDIDEGLQSQDRAAVIGAPVPDSNNQFQQNPPFASSPLYQQQPIQYGQHLQAYSQQAVANLPHHEQLLQLLQLLQQQQQPVLLLLLLLLLQLPHQSPLLQEPPIYTKKITKKNVEEIRKSFAELRQEIRYALQKTVAVDPAFVLSLSDRINGSLDRFELELNGPPPARQQQLELGVPIYDLNHEIYTVFEIVEEWYKIDPPIAQRIQQFGEDWIRDEIDHNTFTERRSIVEFVEKMAKECNVDIYVIANDCDRYIRDKSILDEFISEIELDYDDLYKRIMRYRQRRS